MFASKICFLTCLLVIVQQPIASAERKTLRFTKSHTDIAVESAQKNSVEAVAEDVKENQSAEPHALLESQKESKASGPYGGYGYGNGYNTYGNGYNTYDRAAQREAGRQMMADGFRNLQRAEEMRRQAALEQAREDEARRELKRKAAASSRVVTPIYSSSSSTGATAVGIVHPAPAEIAMRTGGFYLWHFLMGMLYYFRIVKKYPKLESTPPTQESRQLQKELAPCALCNTSCPNICLSWCCLPERAAQTFDSAGVLDYWPACLAMLFFPCCTLWMVSSCTDLNEKLGGEKYNCCKGCLCASCCGCCMVAQDAESLDLVTRAKTEFFSVAGMYPPPVPVAVPQVAAQQAVMAAPAPVTTVQ